MKPARHTPDALMMQALAVTRNMRLFIILIILLLTSVEAHSEAGLSEIARVRRFWLLKPFALDQFQDEPKKITLFVGYDGDWTDIFLPHGIGWIEGRVENVKSFGIYEMWMIYGETWDRKWYIATTNNGILTKVLDNEASWKKAIRDLGGPSELSLSSFEHGYSSYVRNLWYWRFIKFGLFSIPWVFVLFFVHRKYKKKIESLSEAANNSLKGPAAP